MHADELFIDVALVRALIAEQYPERSTSRVHRLETTGTVNAIFPIDHDLVARLPLRATSALEVRTEAVASTAFATVSTVEVPRLVHLGAPTDDYPSAWSIQTWLSGETSSPTDLAGSIELAADLVNLIRALREVDTRGAQFAGTGRGGRLTDHDSYVEHALSKSAHLVDIGAVSRLWRRLRDAPRTTADVMSHCDLIPDNLLVGGGRLVGVLDAGGYGPADPSLDLIAFWHLFDAPVRTAARQLLQVDDGEWRRGAAWALQQSMGLIWYYEHSNPAMSRQARLTLSRVLGDPDLNDPDLSDPYPSGPDSGA